MPIVESNDRGELLCDVCVIVVRESMTHTLPSLGLSGCDWLISAVTLVTEPESKSDDFTFLLMEPLFGSVVKALFEPSVTN